jgi:hypothetical protein
MSPLVIGIGAFVVFVYVVAFALCKAAADGDRRIDEEEER